MQRGVKEDGSAAADAPENVKALPLNEQIAARLRADVLSGRLPADHRLLQEDLAARFQVSRIPVRDALRMLEAEGLITTHPRLGTKVAALSVEDLEELYEMRIALEPRNARRAVEALRAEDDEAMVQHLSGMASAADDVRAWFTAHAEFHRTLNERSGRSRINPLLESLRGQTERYVRFFQMVEANPSGLLMQHDLIMLAAKRRDADAVELAVRDHLELVRDRVMHQLRARG